MRANYTLTPGGDPVRGEGQLITNAVWYWMIVPALVIAGIVIVIALVSLGQWSATPTTTTTSVVAPPQPQKIAVEVRGLSTAVNKLDHAVDKLDTATGKISGLASTQPPPPTPIPAATLQVEVNGSLAIRQQAATPTTDVCTAPKESLTPREREWRFWNCPDK